jgi:hypothetical protein
MLVKMTKKYILTFNYYKYFNDINVHYIHQDIIPIEIFKNNLNIFYM